MGIFTVVRHTRDDEEQGRLELVGATAVGRQAPLAAALVVAFGGWLVLIPLIAAVQVILGYPLAGSLALGAAVGLSGCVFAAVAAVCAQLTVSARTARGLAVAARGSGVPAARGGRRGVGRHVRGCAGPPRWAGPSRCRCTRAPDGWSARCSWWPPPSWPAGARGWPPTATWAPGLLPVRSGRAEAAAVAARAARAGLAAAARRPARLGAASFWPGAVLGSAASGIGAVLTPALRPGRYSSGAVGTAVSSTPISPR